MLTLSFKLRELFHLNLLRHLGVRLSGRAYALKGGICLRFFHHSPRLSEDMDLDISSRVRKETLENAVDSIIHSRSFLSPLIPRGLIDIKIRKPKQTETTQRWKFLLILSKQIALPTKLEFSRRRKDIIYCKGIPNSEILAQYQFSPFASQYYDSGSMAEQKILALSSPSRNAVRDLFDLHHLFFNIPVQPEKMNLLKIEAKEEIEHAYEKISKFSYNDFKEQVLPFLTETMISLYKDKNIYEELRSKVEEFLIGRLS
ncbi:MAG: nucleotidyl transferase AbiEii/AbiGii toxin family protein [Elusimicrobia bacterium]|nr:nucleotidyl transferase AbiEii/AbiGii toxin family protein [Elusimicrobiota bacterium]